MKHAPDVRISTKRKRFRGALMGVIESPDNTPCILGDLNACSRVFMERLPEKE